jgi:hypothetical protein
MHSTLPRSWTHRRSDINARTSPRGHCDSMSCAMSTSSPMRLLRSRFGYWRCFTAAEIRDLWLAFFATESNRDGRGWRPQRDSTLSCDVTTC